VSITATSDNLALTASWWSPVTRRPLAWLPERIVFAGAGEEAFGCLDGEIPDFRPGAVPLTVSEIAAIRARLERWWDESPPATPSGSSSVAIESAWRYWYVTARAEVPAFLTWLVRGRPPYTQRESMERYRTVADVVPNAERRLVTVLADGRPATTPLMTFKRLSLGPLLDLIDAERIGSVLDFGCGWGANTILLKQLRPRLDVWSFDLSPERVVTTRFNLQRLGLTPYRLFVADGSRLPLPDGAVDLVLSTHVLEQMAEVLEPALAEIHRVARRFAWHVEPTYRFARWPHRLRMHRLGYPRDVADRARRLGWTVAERRLANPAWGRTPGELIVLRK
jgi:SAM-dependent methyltransferase